MARLFARLSQALQKNKTAATDSRTALGVGIVIDQRYRLDAEIGRGGMGIVYRARDIPNDRDVAVKVISAADSRSLQQFSLEADIAARLHHPHIVPVYETGTVDGGADEPQSFIAMELVQGTSLAEMTGLTYARIIHIAEQICDALEYAHNQGLVYRDLKPGNVMLEKCGFECFVKLLDFGLARPRGEAYLPSESNLAGTVFYLAPELISGQPADIGSDLYALGATMYEMVTGRVPFFDIDERNILSQHLEEKVPPPSQSRDDVPPQLDSIILRLLEKDPKDRFASAQEVRLALEQINLTSELASHGNLPQMDFTGSEEDVAKVVQLLETSQLVILQNDGGRMLALATGTRLMDVFTDGVWLVELGEVTEPGDVLKTVAATLGVIEDPNRPLAVMLIGTLREKNLLLLLDPCDHLLGACAQLVETILNGCSDVRILAVSRQPLNLPVEKCYPESAA